MKTKPVGILFVLTVWCISLNAIADDKILLWRKTPPVAAKIGGEERFEDERVYNVRKPEMLLRLAPKETMNGTAVIIFPGGAYQRLSIIKEGEEIAAWLNGLGISAFIVKNRLMEFGHPAPLMDGLRAVQLVRKNAERWNINPAKIGILGFSAGGHLAASVGVHFEDTKFLVNDLKNISARPDFMVLIYPVITFKDPYTHAGSRTALLGEEFSQDLIQFYSNETQVNPLTPPTFLVHGNSDTTVPAENSILFYQALRANNIPAELHIYQVAAHGFGLRAGQGPASEWPQRCEEWFKVNSLLN